MSGWQRSRGCLQSNWVFLNRKNRLSTPTHRGSRRRHEAWWPGECSPYAEVKPLLPNHLFDFTSNKVKRFWPYQKLEKQDFESSIPVVGKMLKGLLDQRAQPLPPGSLPLFRA